MLHSFPTLHNLLSDTSSPPSHYSGHGQTTCVCRHPSHSARVHRTPPLCRCSEVLYRAACV